MAKNIRRGRPSQGTLDCRGPLQWRARLCIDGEVRTETFETEHAAKAWLDGLCKSNEREGRLELAVAARALTLAEAMRRRLALLTGAKSYPTAQHTTERLIREYPGCCRALKIDH